ncbi:MAG: hypothetical protein BKP49_05490 [Treponema sp. CETP13]|nr:MAG: hypothetical protein BKP49_05490 [Treponema sp. CETP13]
MNYKPKKVELYQDLTFSKDEKCFKNESLTIYKNTVSPKDMDPKKENYLVCKEFKGWANCKPFTGTGIPTGKPKLLAPTDFLIPKGAYLFVQGLQPKEESEQNLIFAEAAEALHLESLWQEIRLDNCVYMRKLKENGKILFQLFRKII